MEKIFKLSGQYLFKEFNDGVVLYIPESGETIQIDKFSFSLLEILSSNKSNLTALADTIKNQQTDYNTIDISTLTPYLDALMSIGIVVECH